MRRPDDAVVTSPAVWDLPTEPLTIIRPAALTS